MLTVILAAAFSYVAMINDPASVRYCVATAQNRIADAGGNPDPHTRSVEEFWGEQLHAIKADDPELLHKARSEVGEVGPGGIEYLTCAMLMSEARYAGGLAAMAEQFDAIPDAIPAPLGSREFYRLRDGDLVVQQTVPQ